jgi:hypothetical protein
LLPVSRAELIELVARIDAIDERTERLETLEFGTVAFPTGGGMTCLEHHELTAPMIGYTFTAIPQTHRHLLMTYKVRREAGDGGNDNQQWRLNADSAANYGYLTFRRHPAGNTTESSFIPFITTAWVISLVSGDDLAPNTDLVTGAWTNGWMLLEDYSADDITKTCHVNEFGYVGSSENPRGVNTGNTYIYGGGHYELTTPITSFQIRLPSGASFGIGSQWTIFGLCPLT